MSERPVYNNQELDMINKLSGPEYDALLQGRIARKGQPGGKISLTEEIETAKNLVASGAHVLSGK